MAGMSEGDADARVRDFFGSNAELYSKSRSHASGDDLKLLLEYLKPGAGEHAVDMATGTGFTAVEIAKKVSHVVAVDETREMLDKARELASGSGIANMEFLLANVNDTHMKSGSTDLITVRRAAHHFTDKARFLAECHRILRNGGRLGFVDMVSPEHDPEDYFNRLEIARDPSHVGALPAKKWRKMIEESGFTVKKSQVHAEIISFSEWLYPVVMESAGAARCLEIIEEMLQNGKNPINYSPVERTRSKERIIIVSHKED